MVAFAAGEILTAAKLNAFVTPGAWAPWAVAFTANFTKGDATDASTYFRAGNLIIAKLDITFGSTSAITSALPVGTLPVAAAADSFGGGTIATFRDVSASADYDGIVRLAGSTSFYIEVKNAAGANDGRTGISSTTPFTWATGDILEGILIYEAAP